jgi:kexin
LGEWTIRVSDQTEDGVSGSFLGWNLVLWGSAIDPNLAKPYEVDPMAAVLSDTPPPIRPSVNVSTSTTQHSNPTAALPSDHYDVPAETESPAFPSKAPDTTAIPSSSTLVDFITARAWVFGFALVTAILGVIFCVVRKRQRRRSAYMTLATEEGVGMAMFEPQRFSASLERPEQYHVIGDYEDDDQSQGQPSRIATPQPHELRNS